MRLIDFNCDNCVHMNVCPSYMVTKLACKDYLPIGNVIPVVRCVDCYHWDAEGRGCSLFLGFGENDFCSYGERKEGAE